MWEAAVFGLSVLLYFLRVLSDLCSKEEKQEEPEQPKYRDRAKERREDQNPDYEITELTSFHAVAPPGNVDLLSADAHKLSIEKSKYLGGDVEHTHLVKGLDYALLHKVRSEIDKKPDVGEETDGKSKGSLCVKARLTASDMPKEDKKDDQPVTFRTASAKSVYQWIVKPQTVIKTNEMFLPGRMAFVFNMENGYSHDIPTTVHRSKADCPVPEEMVTVSVDGSVLDRIAKIMSYLRLGSSGKVLKKKKKDKDTKGKILSVSNGYEEDERILKSDSMKNQTGWETLPPPPPLPKQNLPDKKEKREPTGVRKEEEDIFVGEGIDYAIPSKDMSQSPISEDMEESPRNKDKNSYFAEPAYGPVPPAEMSHGWQQSNGYDALQAQALAGSYQGEWQNYQYAEQLAYPEQYLQQDIQSYDMQAGSNVLQDPRFMTQEEKDRGLGSVFKRDDQRLQQLREKDAREKDPNFISESYSECYPGYQEYNREIVDSDDEDDLSKMDMGGRKEAMPKAAFQFGVKMQDGRKTRKQNREQKLTNDLHKINKILARKKAENGEKNDDSRMHDDESHPGKKLRI
ncbi:UNVERIFIED_CONTAM: Suppressor of mec-8 and unc-52 protein2 [Sesamum angustifolium]|uniref:Suppressor of mec-8 and unc-52 protein2 n=1 Tax=Sesamum angustifolium TaxID=2727405 RepID=A0AAW2N5S5_9LAMI